MSDQLRFPVYSYCFIGFAKIVPRYQIWLSILANLMLAANNMQKNEKGIYWNCFRYLDGDIPIAFVNTRTKWGRSLKPTV